MESPQSDYEKQKRWREDLWAFIKSCNHHWKELGTSTVIIIILWMVAVLVFKSDTTASTVVCGSAVIAIACFLAYRESRQETLALKAAAFASELEPSKSKSTSEASAHDSRSILEFVDLVQMEVRDYFCPERNISPDTPPISTRLIEECEAFYKATKWAPFMTMVIELRRINELAAGLDAGASVEDSIAAQGYAHDAVIEAVDEIRERCAPVKPYDTDAVLKFVEIVEKEAKRAGLSRSQRHPLTAGVEADPLPVKRF